MQKHSNVTKGTDVTATLQKCVYVSACRMDKLIMCLAVIIRILSV